MTDTPKKLSDTARAVLTFATTRSDHLVRPPQLPAAARQQVARSLLKGGLVEEIDAPIEDAAYAWRTSENGAAFMLRVTPLGLARIGEGNPTDEAPATDEAAATAAEGVTARSEDAGTAQTTMILAAAPASESPALAATPAPQTMTSSVSDVARSATLGMQEAQLPNAGQGNGNTCETGQPSDAAKTALTVPTRATRQHMLWQIAQALLAAWDDPANRDHDLIGLLDARFAALRIALAGRTPRTPVAAPRKPRENTKQAQVLTMLRRPEGATVAQIAAAMGWAPHTVRGFLAGLGKKGTIVEVLERVRQVGPNKAGAKGSYTVYRVAR